MASKPDVTVPMAAERLPQSTQNCCVKRRCNVMSKFSIKSLDLYYGKFKALKDISLELPEKEITAFIGPSGYGKSTLLKSINRMNV